MLAIPTVPGPAPRIGLPDDEVERTRTKTMQLSCIAGLGGLPQVTIPIDGPGGSPVGLSFIAGPQRDKRLLRWVSDRFSRRDQGQATT
ncbi:hypothetical protein [Cohnella rhizosphaerae]|uniref:hypothetical protein n=1 Tax=Cohnella rhizosphaerae TaxID=1457232 RepID=UPI0030B8DAC2